MASDFTNIKGYCPYHPQAFLQISTNKTHLYCPVKTEGGFGYINDHPFEDGWCDFTIPITSLKPKERQRVERKLNENSSH